MIEDYVVAVGIHGERKFSCPDSEIASAVHAEINAVDEGLIWLTGRSAQSGFYISWDSQGLFHIDWHDLGYLSAYPPPPAPSRTYRGHLYIGFLDPVLGELSFFPAGFICRDEDVTTALTDLLSDHHTPGRWSAYDIRQLEDRWDRR